MNKTIRIYFAHVLGTDEATSALDGTSRLLVFEAIKKWRKNRTTIVITHDLSQIGPDDFVYVLSQGRVVEQGFRRDLEEPREGEFYQMMTTQGATGGFLPVKDVTTEEKRRWRSGMRLSNRRKKRLTRQPKLFDTGVRSVGSLLPLEPNYSRPSVPSLAGHSSHLPSQDDQARYGCQVLPRGSPSPNRRRHFRRSSLTISIPRSPEQRLAWKRSSLQFSPSSPTFLRHQPSDMTMRNDQRPRFAS
jgi:ATP-binding cassette subfamily B (MDR/TAP) protein 1